MVISIIMILDRLIKRNFQWNLQGEKEIEK